MSLALCLQVVSQASQHLRSSEKQATYEGGGFARQSICWRVHPYFRQIAYASLLCMHENLSWEVCYWVEAADEDLLDWDNAMKY